MGSEQKAKIGAVTRSDLWGIPPENLYSPRSDPAHPEHAEWKERTNPENPITAALIENMRQNGTDEAAPVIYFRENVKGGGARNILADGDRRHAACLFVNRERKAARKPALVLRAVVTQDPVLARQMANACRLDDPPMVLARRYRESRGTLGDMAAAAANGLRLDTANALLKCLSLPADIQAKVNAKEIPPDVAARMAKVSPEEARDVVRASTGSDGKVNGKRVRAAAREATGTRAKSLPAHVLMRLEQQVQGDGQAQTLLRATFALARGECGPALSIPDMREILLRAGYDEEKGRLPTGPTKRGKAKGAET